MKQRKRGEEESKASGAAFAMSAPRLLRAALLLVVIRETSSDAAPKGLTIFINQRGNEHSTMISPPDGAQFVPLPVVPLPPGFSLFRPKPPFKPDILSPKPPSSPVPTTTTSAPVDVTPPVKPIKPPAAPVTEPPKEDIKPTIAPSDATSPKPTTNKPPREPSSTPQPPRPTLSPSAKPTPPPPPTSPPSTKPTPPPPPTFPPSTKPTPPPPPTSPPSTKPTGPPSPQTLSTSRPNLPPKPPLPAVPSRPSASTARPQPINKPPPTLPPTIPPVPFSSTTTPIPSFLPQMGITTPSTAESSSDEDSPREYSIFRMDDDGGYFFEFAAANSLKQKEEGKIKSIGDERVLVKMGSFSYKSPEGKLIALTYEADELGFRASGDHLPTHRRTSPTQPPIIKSTQVKPYH